VKSSKYYQKWLQFIARFSDIVLFLSGFFLGKEIMSIAILMLIFKIIMGYTSSELVYKRLKASIEEGKET
jgi:predicted permease